MPTYTTQLDLMRAVTAGDLNSDSLNVDITGGTVVITPSGTQDINLKQIAGNTTSTGNGIAGTGVQRVTIASDNTAFTVNAAQSGSWTTGRTWTLASGTDSVSAVQSGTWTVQQGSAPWSVSQSGTWNIGTLTSITNAVTVSQGTAANLNATVVGTGTFAVQATPAVSTSGGMTRFRNTALSNTAVAVKASAGNLYYFHIQNTNSADSYLQLYNVAQGSVSVGTTTPDLTLAVPAGGVLDTPLTFPYSFSTAITIAATTTITGGSAPSTGLLVAIGYN